MIAMKTTAEKLMHEIIDNLKKFKKNRSYVCLLTTAIKNLTTVKLNQSFCLILFSDTYQEWFNVFKAFIRDCQHILLVKLSKFIQVN